MQTARVAWPRAHRIISSIHPPIDLFEDTSDPADWELLVSLESKGNPRVRDAIGVLSLVPPDRRVSGPGASYVMAPFTHISPEWKGRFHDGSFGAYYAADTIETALAETIYHRGNIYRATDEKPGWFSQYRELVGSVDNEFHDVHTHENLDGIMDPDSYTVSQILARKLRADGSNGLFYPSARFEDGQCIAAFWPDAIGIPAQGRHFAYHFDGDKIDMYRNESTGEVFRVVV